MSYSNAEKRGRRSRIAAQIYLPNPVYEPLLTEISLSSSTLSPTSQPTWARVVCRYRLLCTYTALPPSLFPSRRPGLVSTSQLIILGDTPTRTMHREAIYSTTLQSKSEASIHPSLSDTTFTFCPPTSGRHTRAPRVLNNAKTEAGPLPLTWSPSQSINGARGGLTSMRTSSDSIGS